MTDTAKQPPREKVLQMFDRIASRYDLLNHLLSFGQDIRWRKKVERFLPEKTDLQILDLATGTGDQLIYLFSVSRNIGKGIGIDLSSEMLAEGREKIRKRRLINHIVLEKGDAEAIPYEENRFDAVTISFGIRNVTDVKRSISEMFRVLKPNGRVIILEFSLPPNRFIRGIYLFYFRHLLPHLGGIISGDSYAYRYLNNTVESFPYGEVFSRILRETGFEHVRIQPLTFGVSTIYCGEKPSDA